MAFVLSCTLSDRIAAVGIVAGAQSLPPGWCTEDRAVPVIIFHGAADPIAPYDGGPLGDPFNPVRPVLPAVQEWVGSWASRNRCMERFRDSVIARDVSRIEYADCATTRAWSSTQSGMEVTPGPVASPHRSGGSAGQPSALTQPRKCGRSFSTTRSGAVSNEVPARTGPTGPSTHRAANQRLGDDPCNPVGASLPPDRV